MPARNWCGSSPATRASASRPRSARPRWKRPASCRRWPGSGTARSCPTPRSASPRRSKAVFLALPEANAAEIAPALLARGVRVIDLSGAFRLRDDAARAQVLPGDGDAAGRHRLRPDRARSRRRSPRRSSISYPGCYPTAALLALLPLEAAGLLEGDVIVDAKSGVSGAGKAPTRADALLREPRQRRGLRRVRPPPRRRDRAGAGPRR